MTTPRTSDSVYFLYCDGNSADSAAVASVVAENLCTGKTSWHAPNCVACDIGRVRGDETLASRVTLGFVRGRSRIFHSVAEGLCDATARVDYRILKRADGILFPVPDSDVAMDRVPTYIERLERERAELGCSQHVPAVFVRTRPMRLVDPVTLRETPTPRLDREMAMRAFRWPGGRFVLDGEDFVTRVTSAVHLLLECIDAQRMSVTGG